VGEDQPLGSSRPTHLRRPRITLAVSMALVACLAVPMAWVANHARIQALALSAIRRAGGFVIYGFQRSLDGMILVESIPDPAPSWLRGYVPEHYYRDFNVIALQGKQVDDATLRPLEGLEQVEELYLANSGIMDAGLVRLRGLKHLKFLDLSGTRVMDAGLAHLTGLRELNYLRLSGTQVTDVGLIHLSGLRELRSLLLDGTRVTDAGLARLIDQDQLIKLSLDGTQVGDGGLEHLKSHEQLISVSLSGTRVSPGGIAKLKNSMPKLQYVRYP
jgi:hypothetical protein